MLRPYMPRPGRWHTDRSLPCYRPDANSVSARQINRLRGSLGAAVWQRGYFEHILRSQHELDRLRRYIELNPLRWSLDKENPAHT